MDSNIKGNIGEAEALKYFVENGYEVYIPFGTATKCDLVVIKDNKVNRVSVKTTTSKKNSGKYEVNLRQKIKNKSIDFNKEDSDLVFIYVLTEKRFVVLESSSITNKNSINV